MNLILPLNTEIRALSWKQPFAELMLHGKIETRVWDTKYRGLVLICASKRGYSSNELSDISGIYQEVRIINTIACEENHWLHKCKLGVAIAVGRLVNSRPMTKEDEDACFVQYHIKWNLTDRKDGTIKLRQKRLWCHIYESVREIEPFEWKGCQGWKILDQSVIDKIRFKPKKRGGCSRR